MPPATAGTRAIARKLSTEMNGPVMGARGSLFISATQKTPEPVTAPKADNARWTGTKNPRRCGDVVLWGCFKTCKIMVSFDVAQDREPVERPFHHL